MGNNLADLPHSPPPHFRPNEIIFHQDFRNFKSHLYIPSQKKRAQKLVCENFQVDDDFADLWDLWHLFQKLACFTGTFSCLRRRLGRTLDGSRPPYVTVDGSTVRNPASDIKPPVGMVGKNSLVNNGILTKPHQAQVVSLPDFWLPSTGCKTVTYPIHTH